MTLYHRTLTYVQLRSIDIAVNELNAVCGVVIPLDDKYIVQGLPPPQKPHRAFERHIVNGKPKPIESYFINVH